MNDEPSADEPTDADSKEAAERDGIVDQQDAVLSQMNGPLDADGDDAPVNETEEKYGEDESPA